MKRKFIWSMNIQHTHYESLRHEWRSNDFRYTAANVRLGSKHPLLDLWADMTISQFMTFRNFQGVTMLQTVQVHPLTYFHVKVTGFYFRVWRKLLHIGSRWISIRAEETHVFDKVLK